MVEHISGDDLEGYVMGRLTGPATERIEEHLLLCGECRVRLQLTEDYVRAMRAASQQLEEPE